MSSAYPQAAAMASAAMVRNLDAQARAIWPQEQALFARYGQPNRIFDVGCGTGEITARLAALYPSAQLHGVDVDSAHLERARIHCQEHAPRTTFALGDVYDLEAADGAYDLVVCGGGPARACAIS